MQLGKRAVSLQLLQKLQISYPNSNQNPFQHHKYDSLQLSPEKEKKSTLFNVQLHTDGENIIGAPKCKISSILEFSLLLQI